MSPSEFSLRRALRDGEGESLDPDAVMHHAEAFRRARRARVGGMVAAASVVAAIGVGGGLLSSAGGNSGSRSDTSAGGAAVAKAEGGDRTPSAPQSAAFGQFPSSAPSDTGELSCPSGVPEVPFVTRAGAHFFDGPVATVGVCGYDPTDQPAVSGIVLTASDASAVATSLEAAPVHGTACPTPTVATAGRVLVIQAWYASGTAALPIVAHLEGSCVGVVTNGGVTRYDWAIPHSLDGVVTILDNGGSSSAATGSSVPRTSPTS